MGLRGYKSYYGQKASFFVSSEQPSMRDLVSLSSCGGRSATIFGELITERAQVRQHVITCWLVLQELCWLTTNSQDFVVSFSAGRKRFKESFR